MTRAATSADRTTSVGREPSLRSGAVPPGMTASRNEAIR
jgi:hypothetical protein